MKVLKVEKTKKGLQVTVEASKHPKAHFVYERRGQYSISEIQGWLDIWSDVKTEKDPPGQGLKYKPNGRGYPEQKIVHYPDYKVRAGKVTFSPGIPNPETFPVYMVRVLVKGLDSVSERFVTGTLYKQLEEAIGAEKKEPPKDAPKDPTHLLSKEQSVCTQVEQMLSQYREIVLERDKVRKLLIKAPMLELTYLKDSIELPNDVMEAVTQTAKHVLENKLERIDRQLYAIKYRNYNGDDLK